MRRLTFIILLITFLFSCADKSKDQNSQSGINQSKNKSLSINDNFPNKIKDIEHLFVSKNLRSYNCSDIEQYFYDNGVKVNTSGLNEIDSTFCRQIFENYNKGNLPICGSYLFSIDKPIHSFFPITIIQFGAAERPVIMILFNEMGHVINALEVANSYGEVGGCLRSDRINDSTLMQYYEWKEYDIDSVSQKDILKIDYLTKETTITSEGKIIEKELKRWSKTE